MFFTRLAMASVCVAGLGVGLAGPANAADPQALGTYTFEGRVRGIRDLDRHAVR